MAVGIGVAANVPVVEFAKIGQQGVGAGEYVLLLPVAHVVSDELLPIELEAGHSLLIHFDAALAPAERVEHLLANRLDGCFVFLLIRQLGLSRQVSVIKTMCRSPVGEPAQRLAALLVVLIGIGS